jgi:hypothetical protein
MGQALFHFFMSEHIRAGTVRAKENCYRSYRSVP